MSNWLFEPPTVEITHSIDNGYTDSERFGIRFKTLLGETVYLLNGTWHGESSPPPDKWQAADVVYWGGHQYIVDDATHDALVAAGLWNGAPGTGFDDIFTDIFYDTFGVPSGGGSSGDVFTDVFSDTF